MVTNEHDIRKIFEKFGPIDRVQLVIDAKVSFQPFNKINKKAIELRHDLKQNIFKSIVQNGEIKISIK